MTDISINDVTRRVQFTGNTTTGPFAFTFNILADSDIQVYKNNTLQTLTTHYTVSTNANGTGSVTLTSALIASDVLTIIGGRAIARTTDFVTAGDLLASSLNEQLDSLVIMSQQLSERIDRTLRANPGDPNVDLTLPVKADRASKIVAFNSDGDLSMGTSSSLDLSLNTVTIAEIDSTGDLEIQPQGGQVNINGTAGQDRIRFNNDATPSMDVFGAFSIDGNNTLDINCGGTFTVDSGGDINLDGNGGDVRFKDNGITQYTFRMTGVPRLLSHQNGFLIETDSSGDIDIQADGGQVNILGTSGEQRITFNNDATPTMQYYQNSYNLSLGSDTLTANRTITLPDASGTVLLANGDGSGLTGVQPDINDADPDSSSQHYIVGVASTGSGEKTLEMDGGITFTPSSNRMTMQQLAIYGAPTGTGYIMFEGATENAFETFIYAVDPTADRAIYFPDKGGTLLIDVVDDTTPQLGGDLASNGNDILFADNDKAKFGDSGDLEIFHDSFKSIITDVGTGQLAIRGENSIVLEETDGTNYVSCVKDGTVALYYAGTETFRTTSTGVDVSGDVEFDDNGKAIFGAGSDLQIYHDGSRSIIQDNGTGNLRIQANNLELNNADNSENYLFAANNGAVTLYYDNVAKLATASTGVDVTGTVTATQFTATSDLAKKENLEVVDNALNKVQTLTGYTYNMKEDGSRKAGLIAQDVEKILPEAVSGEEGNKALDYSATIALLVNAIKEQQEQIDYLRREIEA